ncbi:MAG: RagB/SusD family nutrient uptake outer membrane protein [Paludibacter sp.]
MNCSADGISLIADNDVREFTGLYPKKYICLGNGTQNIYTAQGLQFQINQYTDFTVIRYADVLLMLSELTGNAKYMNEVRARVGLTAVPYSVDALRKERKHELAFEGIRYWDLLRYDYTLNYAANAVTYTGTVKNGKATGTKTIDGAKLKACKGLSQIPNNQITLSNNVLKQNDGWK